MSHLSLWDRKICRTGRVIDQRYPLLLRRGYHVFVQCVVQTAFDGELNETMFTKLACRVLGLQYITVDLSSCTH